MFVITEHSVQSPRAKRAWWRCLWVPPSENHYETSWCGQALVGTGLLYPLLWGTHLLSRRAMKVISVL